MENDLRVRLAAFDWIKNQVEIHGDVLSRDLLQQGFNFEGNRVPLVAPQGIFKPRIMDLPLSITTSPNSPYEDSFSRDEYLLYKYRGTDPAHRDNVGLREVFSKQKPLAYFHGLMPGKYLAVWPVFIIGDHPENLEFSVAVDDLATFEVESQVHHQVAESHASRRAYITSTTKVRLHQRAFREKVLEAYRSQCAVCRLRHRELLDAAPIIPDFEPTSRPSVDNGLSLCKLHHAAFDSFILGVSPDYEIKIREDILEEIDGPLLEHGLQALNGIQIILPNRQQDWPDQEALDWKYQRFLEAA